jgi:cell wall-associated NlpC family hydrolase
VVTYAKRFLGTPYRWGGATPAGFDCSGFTSYVYAKFGVRMAHYTGAQYAAYRKVPRNRLRPGDLVFFSGLGHMGIYIGRGRFIHSPSTGGVVRINRMNDGWYRSSYAGAVRPPMSRAASRNSGSVT